MPSFRYCYYVEYSEIPAYSIQVRGTPASGKTVLAQLLADHISQNDPNVRIIWIYGWPLKDVKESGNYRSYLEQQGWVEREKTVFIFDEAQLSYEDAQLWGEFFKSMHDHEECRAIVFASYGCPTSRISIKGTPMVIPDPQRVTLRHVAHEDGFPPTGLLFTRSEFNDLVIKHYPSSVFYFHSSFFDALFDITNGHVGAIHDFTGIIIADDVGSFAFTKSDDLTSGFSHIVTSSAPPASFTLGIHFWPKLTHENYYGSSRTPLAYSEGGYHRIGNSRPQPPPAFSLPSFVGMS